MRGSVLEALGCDEQRRAEVQEKELVGVLGRVTRIDLGFVTVRTNDGVRVVGNNRDDPSIVGDWVVVGDGTLTRLDRRTEISRRMGVHMDQIQAIAANVDAVLIVCALDVGPRLSRLSTFVVIAYDSGAIPIVVLTKCDVHPDYDEVRADVSSGLPGIETLVVSTVTGEGLEELRRRIAGLTIVLLGESGAGKSTLTNALCGVDQLATAAVRRDGQGRHTTTHRELVVLPSGGVVIDTPGIRVVASHGDGDGVTHAFDDVVNLASQCRFSDCAHGDTPGCAIARALADGTLDQQRVESYEHERRELARFERRLMHRARADERRSAASRRVARDTTPPEIDHPDSST